MHKRVWVVFTMTTSKDGALFGKGGCMGLTPAQEKVYQFVRNFIVQRGYAPSYEEIRTHLGFRSLNAVYKHLRAIEERGFLKIPLSNRKRALELLPLHAGVASIPRPCLRSDPAAPAPAVPQAGRAGD